MVDKNFGFTMELTLAAKKNLTHDYAAIISTKKRETLEEEQWQDAAIRSTIFATIKY